MGSESCIEPIMWVQFESHTSDLASLESIAPLGLILQRDMVKLGKTRAYRTCPERQDKT